MKSLILTQTRRFYCLFQTKGHEKGMLPHPCALSTNVLLNHMLKITILSYTLVYIAILIS